MDKLKNPYAPGAGVSPPELAGRDDVLSDALLAVRRNRLHKPARSFIFFGLRGVGKTVLLNGVRDMADKEGSFTDLIEVNKGEPLSKSLIFSLRTILLQLNRMDGVSEHVNRAFGTLRSFINSVKVRYGDFEISFDTEAFSGQADSGVLDRDLSDLFVSVGEAARDRQTQIVILIDEIQDVNSEELKALIMAVHRIAQNRLPLFVVGAGLPMIIKLFGDAKSYAERLFEYPNIGSLDKFESARALLEPAAREGDLEFESAAIDAVIEQTKGYPYFLQEWGFQIWNVVEKSPVTESDVKLASDNAIENLDKNFFRARYERVSPHQKAYLTAMAELGSGPYNTGDVARRMGKKTTQTGPIRDALIKSGMIYSLEHGYADFTVPLFDEFMNRMKKQRGERE